MPDARTVKVTFLGDAKKLSKVMGDVSKESEGLAGKFSSIGKIAGKGIGITGVAAVASLGAAVAAGVKSAVAYEKIQAQTTAVLKSTGGAAGVTKKQIDDLGNSIEGYSAYGNDAVQQGENMLLTFTNIQNKAGKGNDIFNQSTKVLADMSTAMGTDMKTGAIQLGKALNDPTKGLAALSRVGITFSAEQQKQIKAMQASGDVMGAQKVMLKELNKEFGGSAKAAGQTFAGSLARLKNQFGDVMRDFATPLLPALTAAMGGLATLLQTKLVPAFAWLSDRVRAVIAGFQDGSGSGGKLSEVFKTVRSVVMAVWQDGIKPLVSWFAHNLIPAFKNALDSVLPALAGAFNSMKKTIQDNQPAIEKLKAIFKILGDFITMVVVPTLGQIATVIEKTLGPAFELIGAIGSHIVIPALEAIISTFANVVGAIIDGAAKAFGWVPGIGGKLKDAAKSFDKFKDSVNQSLNGITATKTVTLQVQSVGGKAFQFNGKALPAFASGTSFAPGGLALVGERGPEVVDLPRGSRVHTAARSAAMMGGGRMHPDDIAALADAIAARPVVLDGRQVSHGIAPYQAAAAATYARRAG